MSAPDRRTGLTLAAALLGCGSLLGAGCASLLGVDSDDYTDVAEIACRCNESDGCEATLAKNAEKDEAFRGAVLACVEDTTRCEDIAPCFAANVCAQQGGACIPPGGPLSLTIACCDGATCSGGRCE